jgi:hypothetical protein
MEQAPAMRMASDAVTPVLIMQVEARVSRPQPRLPPAASPPLRREGAQEAHPRVVALIQDVPLAGSVLKRRRLRIVGLVAQLTPILAGHMRREAIVVPPIVLRIVHAASVTAAEI